MLTRLKVTGFKNLVDVDVRFGPFTCIAGPNGVGKSNLFDAIRFLSSLATYPLIEAAMSIRDESGKTTDIRSLFYRYGDEYFSEMRFEAEMIIPAEGTDELGQKAKATITFLRYILELQYCKDENIGSLGSLKILEEKLAHINIGDASKHILFPNSYSKWRKSAVAGRRSGSEFISTEGENRNRIIKLHPDGGGGKPLSRQAYELPRTVLSATNAAESPTALLAKRELESWRLLQLEPSALRKPDEFSAPTRLGTDGSHLPATLYRLVTQSVAKGSSTEQDYGNRLNIYTQVSNRLSDLIDDVRELRIDRDERRELLTLFVTGKDGTAHAARSLSDGTLRFLALAVLAQDPEAKGVICLEEPENGIHPERIPAMIDLLQEISVDANEPLGSDNPLRQIIINTHSPTVVQQVPDDSLLVAEISEMPRNNKYYKGVCFSCLPDTWREEKSQDARICSKGKMLAYLNPVIPSEYAEEVQKPPRVIDRKDMQPLLIPDLYVPK